MKTQKRWLKIGAVTLAFSCIAGIGLLFDNFVRGGSTDLIRSAVSDISHSSEAAVKEAIASVDHIASESLVVCSPAYIADVAQRVQHSVFLRQVVVENTNGSQFCGSPSAGFDYGEVSTQLPIPGVSETLSAVRVNGSDDHHVMLKITRQIDHTQSISAFVEISGVLAANHVPHELRNADLVTVSFTDGTNLLRIGDESAFDFSNVDGSHIYSTSLAGDLPIVVKAAMPYSIARDRRAKMYIAVLIIASILAFTYLLLGWKIISSMKAPAFDLEHAIQSGEIIPYYQPVIDLSTGKLAGCEMLARWVKPDGDIISPGVFIEYAEVTGLAVPMTISLMEQVKQDLAEMSSQHGDLKIAINLFAGHFNDMNIVADTKKIFADSSISMNQLVFEITERFPLGENSNAVSVISGFHEMGCKLALDDVGTGHSNLAHVQNLGVDIIKIDKVFVDQITDSNSSAPVLDGLVRMAQEMGSDIVAEGVETKEQAAYLSQLGVKNVQGFLFSPAIPAEKYIALIEQMNGLGDASLSPKTDGEKVVNLFAA